jgi:hypothetical protein
MERKANQCCLCSAVADTFLDMENHILTEHADIFRATPVKPMPNCPSGKKEGTWSTGGEGEKVKNSPQTTTNGNQLDSRSEDGNFETDLMLVLVIVEGKKCPKCNFLATDKTLLNDHKIEKHSRKAKNSMKSTTNKSRQMGKVTKRRSRKSI